jgi:hypothetical protein
MKKKNQRQHPSIRTRFLVSERTQADKLAPSVTPTRMPAPVPRLPPLLLLLVAACGFGLAAGGSGGEGGAGSCDFSVERGGELYSFTLAAPTPAHRHGVLSEDGYVMCMPTRHLPLPLLKNRLVLIERNVKLFASWTIGMDGDQCDLFLNFGRGEAHNGMIASTRAGLQGMLVLCLSA